MAAPAEGVAYPRDAPAELGITEGWKDVEKMADAEQTQKQDATPLPFLTLET
jgi:hypothetical protein